MKNLTTTKIILFVSLIATVILPLVGMNLAHAFTDKYVKAWEVEDKKLMKIQDKIIDLEDLLNSRLV